MSFDLETLYNLLPAIYRIRDLEQSGDVLPISDLRSNVDKDKPKLPLQALLKVIVEQVAIFEENLAQLYDDQFIETCAEWVIPYIGDLVGYHTPHDTSSQSLRGEVANTISYRKRKGTATLLEQLVRDVTGWNAHVVEYFKLIAATQHMYAPRPNNGLIDLRFQEPLDRLGTPFDSFVHTGDIRNIAVGRGGYNIPRVGIFVWRLSAYSLTNVPAKRAFKSDPYRYFFNPLGNNTQLFSHPQHQEKVTQLAGPEAVAMPINRSMLTYFLSGYYGSDKSLLLTVDGKEVLPDPEQPEQKLTDLITISNLRDKERREEDAEGNILWENMPEDRIAIDPVLGRIAFPRSNAAPGNVHSSFHYGFSADMGGGEYHRSNSFHDRYYWATDGSTQVPVKQVPTPYEFIQEALDALKTCPGGGVVEITDSGRNGELPVINATVNQRIELRAADFCRPLLVLEDETKLPEMLINGEEGSQVTINGLVISNGLLRVTGKLDRLTLRHCTLVPGLSLSEEGEPQHSQRPSLIVESANTFIEIDHCIVGGLRVVVDSEVQITDSIVDATRRSGVAYAGYAGPQADESNKSDEDMTLGGALHLENCTVIGSVRTTSLKLASNTIFLAHSKKPIYVERRQEGCVRFSYLPMGSRVPRHYHCQPKDERDAERLEPKFTSLRYGSPGYCQLRQDCPGEIKRGADDEAEMGAFHNLYQAQRETNLRVRLAEYLSFTVEPDIVYMT